MDLSQAQTYMEMAIGIMRCSVSEKRADGKETPKVGAVLLRPDGTIETACRGELRQGDHAEYTLLERKLYSEELDGSVLFATLEPCAPGARNHPKLGCAERIVNARIAEVWVGIEDPDPSVDRKGIQYLIDHQIRVRMFPQILQAQIVKENALFIQQAQERAKEAEMIPEPLMLTPKEKGEITAQFEDFSISACRTFLEAFAPDIAYGSVAFLKLFYKLGMLAQDQEHYYPTGLGLLLFGSRPQLTYPQAVLKCTYKDAEQREQLLDIQGPLIEMPQQVEAWYRQFFPAFTTRSSMQRTEYSDFPLVVLREVLINALVHRDYDLEGAPIYLEITPEAIVVKSPGAPVPPLEFEQIRALNAPPLSRNPKIMFVFNQLKMGEQRGLGLKTIRTKLKEAGLSQPQIDYAPPYIQMYFPLHLEHLKKNPLYPQLAELNQEELKGYNLLQEKQTLTKKEYAAAFQISDRQAERHLKKLVELKLIYKKGSARNTYYDLVAEIE